MSLDDNEENICVECKRKEESGESTQVARAYLDTGLGKCRICGKAIWKRD